MKTILVFVQTLDGKITKWGNPVVRAWSSQEDQNYFMEVMKSSRLTFMGSNTYNVDQTKARPGHLLIVMTSRPSDYRTKEIPGQIEFSNKSPSELTERFKREGYEQLLMVGGAQSATSFLKEQKADEIWITVEPIIFGSGGCFVNNEDLTIDLRLLSAEKLNEKGTMLIKYSVIK
jgi:dihydrofolate reductase